MTSSWHPVQWALIVVVTVGGFAFAALLALVGYLYALSEYWDGAPKAFGERIPAVAYVAMAGVSAAAGPLLAGVLRRSLAGFIVGGIMVSLGATAAAVIAIAIAS